MQPKTGFRACESPSSIETHLSCPHPILPAESLKGDWVHEERGGPDLKEEGGGGVGGQDQETEEGEGATDTAPLRVKPTLRDCPGERDSGSERQER